MATWKKVIVSGSVAELSASLYRSAGQPFQQVTGLASTTVLSGSFSGSFAGDGAGLTNIPYSSITNAPQGVGSGNLIFSGSLTASFTTDTNSVFTGLTVASSSVTLLRVSSSGMVSPGTAFSGSFTVGGATGSRVLQQLTIASITNMPQIPQLTLAQVNQIKSWSTGDPAWNNSALKTIINENTAISDILYFLLRPYASLFQVAGPNTSIYGGINPLTPDTTITPSNTPTSTARVPQGTTSNSTVNDLVTNNWQVVGETLFSGLPSTYVTSAIFQRAFRITAVRVGSTSVQTDANSFGIGQLQSAQTTLAGANNAVQPLTVSASIDFRYYAGNKNSFTSQTSASLATIQRLTGGTTDGVTLSPILNTGTNTYEFQDAKIQNATFGNAIRFFTGSLPVAQLNTISQMGYYEVTASVRVQTGSNASIGVTNADTQRISYFYMPQVIAGLTNPPTHDAITSATTITVLSVTSQSFSGADYLTEIRYSYSSSVAGVFGPVYSAGTDVLGAMSQLSITKGSSEPSFVTYTAAQTNANIETLPIAVAINSSGQIATAGRVFDSAGTTVRAVNTVPFHNDTIRTTGSFKFDATTLAPLHSNGSEVNPSTSDSTWFPTVTFGSLAISAPGTTGQAISAVTRRILQSGDTGYSTAPNGGTVMLWKRTAQGASGRPLVCNEISPAGSGLFENNEFFICETKRYVVDDTLLDVANATSWNTAYTINYNTLLGPNELQQKLGNMNGFLIRPGGNYAYRIPAPTNSTNFKYYATKFSIAGLTPGNKGNLNLRFSGFGANSSLTNMVSWSNTSNDGIACLILFEHGDSVNTNESTPVFVDPITLTGGSVQATYTANTLGTNPFGSSIKVYNNITGQYFETNNPLNWNGTNLDNVVQVPLGSTQGGRRILNGGTANANEFIVLIRYKGDPTPLTSIRPLIS